MGSFGRFGLDEKRKRIKKYALSSENATVWTGENKAKMPWCGENILLRLVEAKTDSYKKVLLRFTSLRVRSQQFYYFKSIFWLNYKRE